jgi:hypothetical protein
MFDRLVEDFCQFDDFCQAFYPPWEAQLLAQGGQPAKKRGPRAGLADSEIMTILVLYHSSRFRNFKAFYEGVVLALLRAAFPKAPCYARFITLSQHVWVPLTVFLLTRMGRRTGIYYIDSTPLPVCHASDQPPQGVCRPGRARQDQHWLVLRLQTASGVQP